MSNSVKTDDVIFNFFKQICDEKDEKKCVELGNNWIKAMKTNLATMEANLEEKDKIKHKEDIQHPNAAPRACCQEFRSSGCTKQIGENRAVFQQSEG